MLALSLICNTQTFYTLENNNDVARTMSHIRHTNLVMLKRLAVINEQIRDLKVALLGRRAFLLVSTQNLVDGRFKCR